MDFDPLFVCCVSRVHVVSQENRVAFGTDHECSSLPRIEMWIHGIDVDIGLCDGELEFGYVGRAVFEFVENGLRNKYLASQFEQ